MSLFTNLQKKVPPRPVKTPTARRGKNKSGAAQRDGDALVRSVSAPPRASTGGKRNKSSSSGADADKRARTEEPIANMPAVGNSRVSTTECYACATSSESRVGLLHTLFRHAHFYLRLFELYLDYFYNGKVFQSKAARQEANAKLDALYDRFTDGGRANLSEDFYKVFDTKKRWDVTNRFSTVGVFICPNVDRALHVSWTAMVREPSFSHRGGIDFVATTFFSQVVSPTLPFVHELDHWPIMSQAAPTLRELARSFADDFADDAAYRALRLVGVKESKRVVDELREANIRDELHDNVSFYANNIMLNEQQAKTKALATRELLLCQVLRAESSEPGAADYLWPGTLGVAPGAYQTKIQDGAYVVARRRAPKSVAAPAAEATASSSPERPPPLPLDFAQAPKGRGRRARRGNRRQPLRKARTKAQVAATFQNVLEEPSAVDNATSESGDDVDNYAAFVTNDFLPMMDVPPIDNMSDQKDMLAGLNAVTTGSPSYDSDEHSTKSMGALKNDFLCLDVFGDDASLRADVPLSRSAPLPGNSFLLSPGSEHAPVMYSSPPRAVRRTMAPSAGGVGGWSQPLPLP